MKIFWMHSHFYNWMGGTVFVFEIVKKLRYYCDVEIVVQNGSQEVINRFENEKFVVHNLKSLSTNSVSFWTNFDKNCRDDSEKLLTIVKERNVDVIITSMFPANVIATKLKGINSYQYCYEPYAPFWDPVHTMDQSLSKRMILRVVKLLFSKVDVSATKKAIAVFTLTPETRHSISNIYQIDSTVTFLGADLDFYRKRNASDISRRYKDNTILLHNTDFTPAKRTNFLLKCLPSVVEKVPNVKLLITCSINDKNRIKELKNAINKAGLSSNVDVLGWVQYDLLPHYYSVADLVVYCGSSNGSGASAVSLFVIEAMACGTPCLRSNESRTEVLDGINGALFNPFDSNEFVDKCATLLLDKDLLSTFASRCRPYVEKRYAWDRVARTVIEKIKGTKMPVG